MDNATLDDPLESVRRKLTDREYRALEQAVRDQIAPAVYRQGLIDGAAKAHKQIATERESRRKREAKKRGERVANYVYFIAADYGAIKIGTSRDPKRRLAVMQTGHAGKLELVACCEGNATVERAYHRQFAEHRLAGEWFAPAPAILTEIDRLKAEGAV